MKIPEKTEKMMNFKIGFIQILPGKSLEENLAIGKEACIEAKNKGADESVRVVIGGEFVHW